MKNQKITFVANNNKAYEIYNVTPGMLHGIELNKNGERRSPNAKTLHNFTESEFSLGLKTGGIIINA